jgi:hypothetical protein
LWFAFKKFAAFGFLRAKSEVLKVELVKQLAVQSHWRSAAPGQLEERHYPPARGAGAGQAASVIKPKPAP